MWWWIEHEWNHARRAVGNLFQRRKLSFITLHYIYLISWAIVGSILIFPSGGISYMDALFFACGASTQSGLNTINVNNMNTAQQVMLYFIPMFTNPIFINGAVVFVRLYWFEKRFQHVAKDAMSLRRTRTSATTQPRDLEKDTSPDEHSLRSRSIVMMNDGHKVGSNGVKDTKNEDEDEDEHPEQTSGPSNSTSSSSRRDESSDKHESDGTPRPSPVVVPSAREVSFADHAEVLQAAGPMSPMRLPEPRSTDQHIAIVERQRHPDEHDTLRIPGPRDFDRGKGPERVDSDDGSNLVAQRTESSGQSNQPRQNSAALRRAQSDHPQKTSITIDDSARPKSARQPRPSSPHITFGRVSTDRSQAIDDDDDDEPRTGSRPFRRARTATFASFVKSTSTHHTYGGPGNVPYLSWEPTVGRNSAFVDLTAEQREELGGIEYRSLKTLAVIVICYFLICHIVGIVCLTPWIIRTDEWGDIVDSDGVNRAWWGIFSTATLFNDVGFTLTPDSFMSFQTAVLPLLLGSILIVIGNTGFPCMLRLAIWMVQLVVPKESGLWEELRFLLDHPRRCFTLLFPAAATWVLFGILVLLNVTDLLFFIVLDLNDPVVDDVAPGYRVLNGLFQATSTRTAGTAVVNIANLHPGIQVSYLIMMYISVFPIAISVRRTNVYEERSLGVYSSQEETEEDEPTRSYVGAHLRKQLSFDLWFIFVGLFIIAIAEGQRIADNNEPAFDLFACLFEIVSAYGTVGLSLGYPGIDASFSAEFTTISKLVICAMMIRGRHRGLPYELDRAILLPSENLHRKEDEDAVRRNRRLSMSSLNRPMSQARSIRSTGAEDGADASGLTQRQQPRSSFMHARDATAKVVAEAVHVDSAAHQEIAKHSHARHGSKSESLRTG